MFLAVGTQELLADAPPKSQNFQTETELFSVNARAQFLRIYDWCS